MWNELLFQVAAHEIDSTQKVSGTAITSMVVVCILLIIYAIVLHIFLKNNFEKNGIAILWGALGYYLWVNCFSKIVYLLQAVALSGLQQSSSELSKETLQLYENIISGMFIVAYSFVFVAWLWAFYRFFVLFKTNTHISKAVNTGYGFVLLYVIDTVIATGSDWLNSIAYNSTSFEDIIQRVDAEDVDRFKDFIWELLNRTGWDAVATFGKVVNYTIFISAIMMLLHIFASTRKAKECFLKAVLCSFVFYIFEFLYSIGLIPWRAAYMLLQLMIAIGVFAWMLRLFQKHQKDEYVKLAERYKTEGFVAFLFKNDMQKETAKKLKNKSNFADYHSLYRNSSDDLETKK